MQWSMPTSGTISRPPERGGACPLSVVLFVGCIVAIRLRREDYHDDNDDDGVVVVRRVGLPPTPGGGVR